MKISTVKGTNDYLPSEVALRDYLQSVILATYKDSGFERISTPAIEDIENLDKSEGGDNLTLTFSPALVDFFIYVIDVAAGDKIPRKDGPGISHSDILVINKTDLAPYVHADLEVMRRDSLSMRGDKPFIFTNCFTGEGVDSLVDMICRMALFER